MSSYAAVAVEHGGGALLGSPAAAAAAAAAEPRAGSRAGGSMRQRVAAWDKDVSRRVYDAAYLRLRVLLLLLELSGHGVPWLVLPALAFLAAPGLGPAGAGVALNYLGAAVLDLAVIAVVKPSVARARPDHNGGMTAVTIHAIDQYSFPSGHATRAGLNVAFVAYLHAARPAALPGFWGSPPFLAVVALWAAAVAASRVALGRHHVTDVAAGLLMGALYVALWSLVWIPDALAASARRSLRHVLFGAAL